MPDEKKPTENTPIKPETAHGSQGIFVGASGKATGFGVTQKAADERNAALDREKAAGTTAEKGGAARQAAAAAAARKVPEAMTTPTAKTTGTKKKKPGESFADWQARHYGDVTSSIVERGRRNQEWSKAEVE